MALATGPIEIGCPPQYQPVMLWVGPKLRSPPDLGPGDHRRLFVNWY
jgi:hypothetical protein